jgi:hypothetical protein
MALIEKTIVDKIEVIETDLSKFAQQLSLKKMVPNSLVPFTDT